MHTTRIYRQYHLLYISSYSDEGDTGGQTALSGEEAVKPSASDVGRYCRLVALGQSVHFTIGIGQPRCGDA